MPPFPSGFRHRLFLDQGSFDLLRDQCSFSIGTRTIQAKVNLNRHSPTGSRMGAPVLIN